MAGREIIHLLPSSTEVKNEWIYTSTYLIRFHNVDREIWPSLLPISFMYTQPYGANIPGYTCPSANVFGINWKISWYFVQTLCHTLICIY